MIKDKSNVFHKSFMLLPSVDSFLLESEAALCSLDLCGGKWAYKLNLKDLKDLLNLKDQVSDHWGWEMKKQKAEKTCRRICLGWR